VQAALARAKTKAEVRALLASHDVNAVNAAWKALKPLDRAALSLMRGFDGEIIHDFDPTADQDTRPDRC